MLNHPVPISVVKQATVVVVARHDKIVLISMPGQGRHLLNRHRIQIKIVQMPKSSAELILCTY